MNRVFELYPRKFVLVLFDDILIYIKSLSEHVEHLLLVSNTLLFNHCMQKGLSDLLEKNHLSEEGQLHAISVAVQLRVQEIATSYEGDPMAVELIT